MTEDEIEEKVEREFEAADKKQYANLPVQIGSLVVVVLGYFILGGNFGSLIVEFGILWLGISWFALVAVVMLAVPSETDEKVKNRLREGIPEGLRKRENSEMIAMENRKIEKQKMEAKWEKFRLEKLEPMHIADFNREQANFENGTLSLINGAGSLQSVLEIGIVRDTFQAERKRREKKE